jgi:hypothetical protein
LPLSSQKLNPTGDYNSQVSWARVKFVAMAGEAAVRFIHRLAIRVGGVWVLDG